MDSSAALKTKIILGSTRQKRFGEHPARWIFEETKKKEGFECELLDCSRPLAPNYAL